MRRGYSGAAKRAVLTFDLGGTEGDLILQCDALVGWYDGELPQQVVIARGTNLEEKLLATFTSSNVLTVYVDGDGHVWRGADGTAISAHSAGATVEHVHWAMDDDESNDHIERDHDVHGVDGSLPELFTAIDETLDIHAESITDLGNALNDLSTVVDGKEPLLPSRSGQDGKFLRANGGWQTVPPGEKGDKGDDGDAGEDGADGATIIYGSAAPTDADGVDGDTYIRTTTHFIYGPKAGGHWPSGVSLIGPAGDDGVDGADGVQIDDAAPHSDKTYSSNKIEDLLDAIGTGGGYVAQDTPPSDTSVLWLNTSDDPDLSMHLFVNFDGDWIEVGPGANEGTGDGTGAAFTTVSSVTVGPFDSTADDYRLIFIIDDASSSEQNVTARLGNSGTPDTGAHYTSGRFGASNTTADAYKDIDGNTKWHLAQVDVDTVPTVITVDLLSPSLAKRTALTGEALGAYSNAFNQHDIRGSHNQNTAYNELVVAIASGTMTGRWMLVKYPKVT